MPVSRIGTWAVVCVALCVLGASRAEAQQHRSALTQAGGWDLHLYRPAVDSKGLLSVNGTDILGANAFSFGLIIDAGFGLLPYNGFKNDPVRTSACVDGTMGCVNGYQRVGRLVDYSFTGTLHFN